jgi:hypothetical protein
LNKKTHIFSPKPVNQNIPFVSTHITTKFHLHHQTSHHQHQSSHYQTNHLTTKLHIIGANHSSNTGPSTLTIAVSTASRSRIPRNFSVAYVEIWSLSL